VSDFLPVFSLCRPSHAAGVSATFKLFLQVSHRLSSQMLPCPKGTLPGHVRDGRWVNTSSISIKCLCGSESAESNQTKAVYGEGAKRWALGGCACPGGDIFVPGHFTIEFSNFSSLYSSLSVHTCHHIDLCAWVCGQTTSLGPP
jgi:hypothetical protein